MIVRDQIKHIISKASGVDIEQINLEHPELEEHGDYSTNIALVLKGGRKLAEEIADKIKGDFIDKVEVAGPGFINITLKPKVLLGMVGLEGTNSLHNKKIMFEYGQPNTHKLPHIGHLFSYMYGQVMCRILEAEGAEVRRVNYQGDVGLHVAKCLWAFKKNNPTVPAELENKVTLLQKMYQEGSKTYEEDEAAKTEIHEINKQIYSQDPAIRDLWQETRQWSIDYYALFEKRIGATFDHYYFESEVSEAGKKIVTDHAGSIFTKSQGAIVFEGSHTRVFVTSEGNPTYEAKDTALEMQKIRDWPADLLVITTASEQNSYFDVVFAALEKLEPKLSGKLKHIGFGMVNLTSGKMSSRTGNIVSGIDLVNQVVATVGDKSAQAGVAEEVGVGAIKYAFLKKGATQDMEFDIDSSISVEGNSGPYLQYTHARTQSILKKALVEAKTDKIEETNAEELRLLRWLYRYPEVVAESASRYAPNLLTNYIYELAQRFNTFYNKHTVIGSDFRIKLTQSVGEVLKAGLNLLGIEALERM